MSATPSEEIEANAFAAEILMPRATMARLDAEKEAVPASAPHPDAEDPAQATD